MAGFANVLSKIGHMWQTIYAMCVTGTLRFESASQNLIGLLTVGNVIGTGVTIGDYVIEWRQGSITGPLQLISGKGSDTSIQAVHPFVYEPVEGGMLYAVIRYIYIDGVKYSPQLVSGEFSPDLKTCLGSVNVVIMNCGNGIAGTYSHTIQYTNNVHPSNNAERNLKLILNSDGSTRYLAWQFNGALVADRVTINYIRYADPEHPIVISDWIVGQNAVTNYSSTPKVYASYNFKMITGITQAYEAGDYIRIHITPRVLEPTNSNTNWTFYLKCLSEWDTTTITTGLRTFDFSNTAMVWDAVNCQWNLTWRYAGTYSYPVNFSTYLQLASYQSYGTYGGNTTDSYVYFRKKTLLGQYIITSNQTCQNQEGSLSVVRTGTLLSGVFTNINDYAAYKANYNQIISSIYWTDYSSDTSSINHLKYINFYLDIATTCGDTHTLKTIMIGYDSVWTWDDATLSFTCSLQPLTTTIPNIACNTSYAVANQIVAGISADMAAADFSVVTHIRYGYPFSGMYFKTNIYDELVLSNTYSVGVPDIAMIEGWTPPAEWKSYPGLFGCRLIYVYGYITNNADPANNFRLVNYLADDGTTLATPVIVYEKANGVQIYPITEAMLTEDGLYYMASEDEPNTYLRLVP